MCKHSVLTAILVASVLLFQNAYPQSWNELLAGADSLCKAQDYDSAISIGRRALDMAEAEFGLEDTCVALVLNELGTYYYYAAGYDEAESLCKRSLSIREKVLGPEHKDVASSLNNLSVLYCDQGKFAAAGPLLERALSIQEKLLGTEHIDVAISLVNLASIYCDQGDFPAAVPPLRRALSILKNKFGDEHRHVATTLNNLAGVYCAQGNYAEAEPLFERALAIREKILGPEHQDVAEGYNNLGGICNEQGKYGEAETLFGRALEIREKVLGPEHPLVANSLGNLALLYAKQGNYPDAEKLQEDALDIYEKVFDSEHPEVARSISCLGLVCFKQGKYSEADSLFGKALSIYEKIFGPDHPSVAEVVHNRAAICSVRGNNKKAESLYERAISITGESLGAEHPDLAHHLESYCEHYHRKGDDRKALELAQKAFEIRKKNFHDGSTVMVEKDALIYSAFMRDSAGKLLSVFFAIDAKSIPDRIPAADVVFSTKGRASEAVFVRAAEVNMLNQFGTLADSLRFARTRLSKLYVSGPGKDGITSHREKLDKANSDKERFESELARANTSYRNLQEALDVDSENVLDILNVLPGRPVIVEYMKYDHYTPGDRKPVAHYLVLVMDRDGVLDIMDLGKALEIDEIVERYRRHILRVSHSRVWPSTADRIEYRKLGALLHERIWLPIEEMVAGSELILIAPDSGLNMVSFAGLIDGDGEYLIEKSTIHYISSGRDLIRLKDSGKASTGLFAIGDPDYNAPVDARFGESAHASVPPAGKPDIYASRNVRSGCRELGEMHVGPLPGTRVEVEKVEAEWKKRCEEPIRVYMGTEASEERFKAEAPGTRVVHLATHGYFLEEARQPEHFDAGGPISGSSFIGENPLLLSGLFLAGANLHGEGADAAGAEDGILTAEEVTTLNFQGTDLVVLSACETGLGEVKSGEGVYGLRRAFQMAGARSVISALWPVTDTVTAEMMSALYGSRREILPETIRRVQLETIAELRNQNRVDHPFIWGAFITIGDWR